MTPAKTQRRQGKIGVVFGLGLIPKLRAFAPWREKILDGICLTNFMIESNLESQAAT